MRDKGISWRCFAYLAALLTVITAVLSGCSRSAQPTPAVAQAPAAARAPAASSADAPPATLVLVGESAEGLFDAARISQWPDATVQLQTLNEAASQLPPGLPNPDLVGKLRSRIDDVRQSAAAHRRVETMDFANSITRAVAELSAEFWLEVPFDVLLLDYYGRQLQLGIATDNQSTLARTTADLQQQWDRVKPTIERLGHMDEAKHFTDIVVQLEGARTPADFVAPTDAELEAVDRLETIFKSRK